MDGPFEGKGPREGKTVKWKFKNETGGPIHNLRIITHTTNWDDADMTKITIRHGGQIDFQQSYPGTVDQGVGSAHCEMQQGRDIPAGEEFEVEIELDDNLGDHPVHFAPSEPGGVMVVAGLAGVQSMNLAMAGVQGPGDLVWSASTLGGLLPVPVTAPLWVRNIYLLIRWILRSLTPAMLATDETAYLGPGSIYTVPTEEDLRAIARKVLIHRLRREPSDREEFRMAKAIRGSNELPPGKLRPGTAITLP